METIVLTNPRDPKYDTVSVNVELNIPYRITIYQLGSYMGVIKEVTGNSIVVDNLKPLDDAPVSTQYNVHGTEDRKAIFPTSEIYDIETF